MTNLPFGFSKPEDSPGFLLWQTTMVWQRKIRSVLETHDISHAQFVIMATLMWCEQHEEVTQISLVNKTKLDKMTVSKFLKRLVASGYVKRVEHHKDTRAKVVSLTEKGHDIVKALVPLVEKVDSEFFSVLSNQEYEEALHVLAQLVKAK